MELTNFRLLIISIFVTISVVNGQTRLGYRVPQPTAAVLSPRGFRISIPDERGIVLFAFHGSINKEIRANEVGDYHGETRVKSNGWWSYENNRYQLQRGDVLHFWVYVQHENFGYRLENQRYVYPEHFVYDTSNYGGSSSDDDTVNYNTGSVSQSWDQDYTTRRTTTTTTTQTPYFVYEEPSIFTQPQTQYVEYTTRPTTTSRKTTRTTLRTTKTTPVNYWQGTTQRPPQQQQVNYQGQQSNQQQNQQNYQNNQNQQNYQSGQNQPNYQSGQNQANYQNTQNQQNYQNQQSNQNEYYQNNQNNNDQQNYQANTQNQQNQQNCRPSITTVNKKRINCKDALIFEEQFNQGFANRWSQDIRMPLEFEDAEFVVYHNYRSVWNVSSSNLHIFPKLLYRVHESGFSESDIRSGRFTIDTRDCTSFIDPKQECERQAGLKRILPPVVTSKFRSKKSFNFKYGRVEIRAKLPKGDWMFPQIYLEPTDNKYRGTGDLAYLNGQVRIAFIRSNEMLEKADGIPLDGKVLTGICVISGGDTVREIARKSIHFGTEHFGNNFHTYSIIWTNSSIRFIVDGLEYGTDTGGYKQLKSIPNAIYWESGTNMAPFDQEFHISLGVAVGGNADFADDSRNGWSKAPKPWENTSPKAELSFYLNADEWYSTWNSRESGLIVDYVKVYSV